MLFRILFFIIAILLSCDKPKNLVDDKPTVLVSLPPYQYFVEKIAQGAVHIETLIPAGANPHIYEATPKEVKRHQNAALWIYLGESFDKRALHFFRESQANIRIVDVAQGIKLLSYCQEEAHHGHCHDEGMDLHIWLSPKLAKKQAVHIASALIALLPERKEYFTANLKLFLDELELLNKQITTLLKPLKNRAILVSHPAFAYFCKDYDLLQLSIEVEGKDPLPQHVTQILALSREYHVQSVLIEPQYSNKGAELIAQTLHLPIHLVDPYAENYSQNLLKIAQVIAK